MSPPGRLSQRWDASHALALGALFIPSVGLLAPLGIAPLSVLVLVLALALCWREHPWRRVSRKPLALIAAIAVWSAISASWSIDPPVALRTSLQLTVQWGSGLLLMGIAAGLREDGRRRVAIALGIGVSIGLLWLLSEGLTPGLTRYFVNLGTAPADQRAALLLARMGRGQTVLALLLAPTAVALWRLGYRYWAGALVALLWLGLLAGHSLASKLGFGLACAVFLGALVRPRATVAVLVATMGAVVVGLPLLAFVPPPQQTLEASESWLPRSAHHRLTIWNFGAQRVLEKPLFGWGLEASRAIPGGEVELMLKAHNPLLRTATSDGEFLLAEQQMPLHPHNAGLQVWLELGAVGIAGLVLLLALIGLRITRLADRGDVAAAAATLGVGFVVSMVSYGAWQSWWQCAMWFAATLLATVRRAPQE